MKFDIKSLPSVLLALGLLAFVIALSAWVRMSTLDSPTVLDYDPHWYYRHAVQIMDNGFIPPKWDILSYYPPGRPFISTLGWDYAMIIFYKIAQIFFSSIAFVKVAMWSPIIMVALGVLPAFLVGRLISNNWGGLVVALLAVLSPTFIGVSMAGYTDNDPVVVFYTFFTTLSILLALKKYSQSYQKTGKLFRPGKSAIFFLALAVITNLLFAFTWTGGWLPMLFFVLFLPALLVFRVLEQFVHSFKLSFNFKEIIHEMKQLLIPLLIIIVVSNAVAAAFGMPTLFTSIRDAFGFIGGIGGLIVNISVAELQPINILSIDGFMTIVGRVGLLPTLFTMIGLPLFVVFKLWRKEKANFMEIFLFLWAMASFLAILRGTRFSLEFQMAAATTAGYIIGNMLNYLKSRPPVFGAAFYGVVIVLTLVFISNSIQIGIASRGIEISGNWYDALDWLNKNGDQDTLVVTWWDPGHIITNLAGRKVMADGAHCAPQDCVPYNHNIRIQDMGRVFSVGNETEALNILRKYTALTPEQCDKARQEFGDRMPDNACDPVKKMYLLATNDLIGKYYWLTYFGTGSGRNYMQCIVDQGLSQQLGAISYGCQTGLSTTISIVQTENSVAPVLRSPQQGIRNAVVRQIIFFQNGAPFFFDNSNATGGALDGLVFVDPSFQVLFYLDPLTRDSLFTNMFFFNGQGVQEFGIPQLNNFTLVYNNPEVKIFEVHF